MDALRRAARRYDNNGLANLIAATLPWAYRRSIRRCLPADGYATRNDVKVQRRRVFDDLLPSPDWHRAPDIPEYEAAIVGYHDRTTEPGDDVVIVGGGFGVSMVAAARATGETGTVVVYEASKRQASLLRRIAAWNGVAGICDVRTALVADDVRVYGGETTDRRVSPAAIEECNVLELDCEGAEERIVSAIGIRPRRIILEIHPHLLDGDAFDVVTDLERQGYRIEATSGHGGESISDEAFDAMLAHDTVEGRDEAFEATHPPVVLARRVDQD